MPLNNIRESGRLVKESVFLPRLASVCRLFRRPTVRRKPEKPRSSKQFIDLSLDKNLLRKTFMHATNMEIMMTCRALTIKP